MSDLRYVLFKGSMQPKDKVIATDSKLKELSSVGYRQGKDYEIVSLKVLEDALADGKKYGGKMYAKGGGVRKARMGDYE